MRLDVATPDPRLAGIVTRYVDFEDRPGAPAETLEVPRGSVTVLIDLDQGWTVEGERFGSFVGGLYGRPIRVRHEGSCRGLQFDLEPPAVRGLLGVPAGELSGVTVGLDQLLGPEAPRLVERLYDAPDAATRFALLERAILRAAARAAPARHPDVEWAWRLLRSSGGRIRIERLAAELGMSRRTLAARFAEDVGAPPKLAARLVRVEGVVDRLGRAPLARLAAEHGFADQAHLTREVRALTGRVPTDFPEVQDASAETS